MEFRAHREYDAPAPDLWRVIGEQFGDLSWSSGVTHSYIESEGEAEGELGVGAVRVCNFPPNRFSKDGQVRERLLTYDRQNMALSYEAVGMSGILQSAVNRWKVTPLGPDRCRVDMHATTKLWGPLGWSRAEEDGQGHPRRALAAGRRAARCTRGGRVKSSTRSRTWP